MQAGLRAGSVRLARQSEEQESGRSEQHAPRAFAAQGRSNRCLAAPSGHSVTSSASDADDVTERSEEHTSELQSRLHLVCRLLLEKKKFNFARNTHDRMTSNTTDIILNASKIFN